jgi:hypothetical protein
MKPKSPLGVMPALAGIHAFLTAQQARRRWPGQAWTSPAMTPGIMMHCLHFNITMRFKKRQTANIVVETKT